MTAPDKNQLVLHHHRLLKLARQLLRKGRQPLEDAEDLVQATFERALPRLGDLEQEPGPWLAAILRNLWCDKWRREERERRRLDKAATTVTRPSASQPGRMVYKPPRRPTGSEVVLIQEALDKLETATADLAPDHRRVYVECGLNGRKAPEVAREMGIPPGRVASFYRTVLDRLQPHRPKRGQR
jgi:RNA polymerase sigma factor (sigma-70 family)